MDRACIALLLTYLYLSYIQIISTMDSHQDDEETKQESSGEETRTLVTALTQQLLVDDRDGVPRVEPTTSVMHEDAPPRINSTSTGNLLFNDQFFCPPTSGTDERDLSVLPEFLSDASIRAALNRANALHPQGHLSDEPQFPSALGGDRPRHLGARDHDDLITREMVGSPDIAASNSLPYSPAPQRIRVPAHESLGVPDRFVSGHESESVLKITKRPRLRPKDVTHRRSLGTNEPGLPLPTNEGSPLGWSRSQPPGEGSPVIRDCLVGLFPSTIQASHFIVVLAFGRSRVSVPGSPYMTVATLRLTAGAIADRNPELLTLMHESRPLELGAVLGDYAAYFTGHAFHVTVALWPASPPVQLTNRNTPNPPITLPRPLLPPSLPVTPPPVTHTSFLILVVFEDGSTMAPVVWGSMSVRRLCQQVGTFANVPSDSVFLYFAGSILDVERSMADSPPIQAGARVYAFFTIAQALRLVVKSLQGGHPQPPITNPPGSAPFGPPLPPGFTSSPSPHGRTPTTGPSSSLASGGSSSVSDKLRSTFKCPNKISRGVEVLEDLESRFCTVPVYKQARSCD
jgi:hypothetical protein